MPCELPLIKVSPLPNPVLPDALQFQPGVMCSGSEQNPTSSMGNGVFTDQIPPNNLAATTRGAPEKTEAQAVDIVTDEISCYLFKSFCQCNDAD